MKTGSRLHIAGMVVLVSALTITTLAQWDKKPYAEWSEPDIQKMLNESPWGKTQTFVEPTVLTGSSRPDAPVTKFYDSIQVNFRIRLFSARPVRQAFSRVIERQQKGGVNDTLAAQLKAFASGEFHEFVIVTVTVDSDRSGEPLHAAKAALDKRTTAELKDSTYLEVAGQKVYLQEFQPPKNDPFGARFIFPRLVDGEPYITSKTPEVRFVTELPRSVAPVAGIDPSKTKSIYRLNMLFKTPDMMFGGRLEY